MGEIDKEKEVMVIYVNKSQYFIGKLNILDLDYWGLKYWYYEIKILLDFGGIFKKDLFRKRPKMEVLNAEYLLYLMAK